MPNSKVQPEWRERLQHGLPTIIDYSVIRRPADVETLMAHCQIGAAERQRNAFTSIGQ